jgi:hypothetical protein
MLDVFFSNHSSLRYGYYLGKGYPVGWLLSPDKRNYTNIDYTDIMPYAVDNGKFAASQLGTGREWDESLFIDFIQYVKLAKTQPRWVVVPDEVGNKEETLKLWDIWSPVLKDMGFNLAFAVQDGMELKDVPTKYSTIFVGGTNEFKWRTAEMWCKEFQSCHVARVNSLEKVIKCNQWGAESIDGTGWFRDGVNNKRFRCIEQYFERDNNAVTQLNLL